MHRENSHIEFVIYVARFLWVSRRKEHSASNGDRIRRTHIRHKGASCVGNVYGNGLEQVLHHRICLSHEGVVFGQLRQNCKRVQSTLKSRLDCFRICIAMCSLHSLRYYTQTLKCVYVRMQVWMDERICTYVKNLCMYAHIYVYPYIFIYT